MTTVADITTQPASGLNHIDALLDSGPGWNWLAPTRNTIYYTFSLAAGNAADVGSHITAAPTAFNATQQAAAVAALAVLTQITGIRFVATTDGSAADIHFADGDVIGANIAGYCEWSWSYSYSGNTVTSYSADAWVYLDIANFASTNNAPTAGTFGFEVLLHELGHAMGLKHPFEGSVTLPAAQDNTANTLMSYTTSGGPYATYSPDDVAALMWLYGGDGLGGSLGQGTPGLYLVGTSGGDVLAGGTGDDVFDAKGGNDRLVGGAGTDTARYSGNRSAYTITASAGGFTISGPEGTDSLAGIELARFADTQLTLSDQPPNSAPTGSLSIGGMAQQQATLTVGSTLADADGMGPLSYRWQASADGKAWVDLAGATSTSLTLTEAQVGQRVRIIGSWVDGRGSAESATSAATSPVLNVNDAPTGTLTLIGTATQNQALTGNQTLADPDGMGAIGYQWQSSANGTGWTAIAGATSGSLQPGIDLVGQLLRLQAQWTDGHGTLETVVSAATAAVLGSQTGTSGNDNLAGSAYIDTLSGGAGNDRLNGGGGNDSLIGGTGIDTAVYGLARANYAITVGSPASGGAITVLARSGGEGSDTLQQVERLSFADGSLAFDLDGHAGTVAKFLGAVFGKTGVADPHYVSVGLGLADAGTSPADLMQLALDTRLGPGFTAEAEVSLLFRNLVGQAPTPADLQYWTGTLASGQYTPVSLALMAADLGLNLVNVDFVGLVQNGLGYD